MIQTNDSHWYLEQSRYDAKFNFQHLIDECERECKRSDEVFIKSYCEKYNSPVLPPAWIMSEILSIGRWSMIFKNLADSVAKKAVARHFDIKPYFLESWLHSLSVLRNLCAHHCRIWNRNFTLSPALPDSLKKLTTSNTKLAAPIVILTHLLKPLGKNLEFQDDLTALLEAYPDVPPEKMGFPQSSAMK